MRDCPKFMWQVFWQTTLLLLRTFCAALLKNFASWVERTAAGDVEMDLLQQILFIRYSWKSFLNRPRCPIFLCYKLQGYILILFLAVSCILKKSRGMHRSAISCRHQIWMERWVHGFPLFAKLWVYITQ